jgi:hypothetical protein
LKRSPRSTRGKQKGPAENETLAWSRRRASAPLARRQRRAQP